MEKFEYKVIRAYGISDTEKMLNSLSKEGWRVIGTGSYLGLADVILERRV